MGVSSVPTQTDMAKERTGEAVTEQDTQSEMARTAEREEQRRDLLHQVEGIEQDEASILFQDTSPRRPMAIIYAMLDGEPLVVTRKRARKLLERRLPDGRFMFVADITKAPTYRKGEEKCFLHKDSEERKALPALRSLAFCPAGQLANAYAKYAHETGGKHVKSYQIWEKHLADAKEKAAIERQDRQFEATMTQNAAILELARSNQGGPDRDLKGTQMVPPTEGASVEVETAEMPLGPLMKCPEDGCEYTGTPQQVGGHKGVHKEKAND